jgi:hypothetical protein
LQFVVLHTGADHDQLFQEQQNVSSYRHYVFLRWPRAVQPFGRDAALVARIHHPVVEFQGVHRLQDGADASHIAVDLGVAEEFGGQVGVETGLDVGRCVDPQRWIEQNVVEQLPGEKRETEKLRINVVQICSATGRVVWHAANDTKNSTH